MQLGTSGHYTPTHPRARDNCTRACYPSTALGKAMDVANRFGPMHAAYEQMLQFLEEGLASADHLEEWGVCNV